MSFSYTIDGFIKVYVDGCFLPDGKISGIGVWFNDGVKENHSLKLTADASVKNNNDCELWAVKQAIKFVQEDLRKGKISIFTDSQYAANYVNQLSNPNIRVQRIGDDNRGIREADKLARQAVGL